jgi:regulation of enolase protein 1 (concanavalin A-like superfamily)
MCRKFIYSVYVVLVLVLAAGVPARADVNIPVVNYSFEEPNVVKTSGWDMEDGALYYGGGPAEVPGWECDGPAPDSGVESIYSSPPATTTDGLWAGWAKTADPPTYNLTNFLIGSGDVFELKVDAKNNFAADNFLLSLYYDDNGTRTTVATNNVAITGNMQTFTLTFNANTIPACYDHEIGIELDNPGPNWGWAGFDYVRLTLTSPLYRAYIPYPEHKGFYGGASVDLTWLKGPDLPSADNYHVYISNNRSEVDSNHPNADQGTVTDPNYLYSGIVQGDTYYWRIDTISGVTTYRGSTWRFSTQPVIAYNPDPETDGRYVPVDPNLSWDAGTGAVEGYVVIFGDSFSEVNNAPVGTSGTEPPYRIYLSDVNDTNCTPAETGHPALDVSTVYYWRVDTVESASVSTIHKGNVWNFQTVPIKGLGSITHEVWDGIPGAAVADLTSDVNYPDNPTFTDYLTSFDTPRERADNYGTRMHGWLYVETTGDYTFWLNSDDSSELWLNNDMIVSASAAIPYHIWPDSPSSAPIHLEAGNLYYIMALQKEDVAGDHLTVAWSTSTDVSTAQIIPGVYLLPRHLYALLWAYNPNPANGATYTRIDPNLSWRPGEYATEHDVYFGTSFNDVNNANISTAEIYKGRQSDTTYIPGTLNFNTTYYWRIDEVNDAHPDKLWKGEVWSFTTGNFLVVDDFEDYDDVDNRIYDTWVDYYVNNTGMTVGHFVPPYAERRIVHSGRQSMYMRYDNDGTVNEGTDYEQSGTLLYSEAQRSWEIPQDWTIEDVNSLTLYFRGIPASFGSFTPGSPIYTMTARGADIWDVSDQFHFAYKYLSGVGTITARVVSVSNTDPWAKAGVMIRESLTPSSPHAMVVVTPGNGVAFQRRSVADAASESVGTDPNIATPQWVRLTRSGNIFTADYSANGTAWTTLGSVDMPMLADVYIGLCLTSRNTAATCTAEFSNVTLPSTATGDWNSQDIGIEYNEAEQLYVALQDSAGNSVVVKHPDPAATTFDTYTEWNIPFTSFTGVNLQAIKKMSIGVGDRANPQLGSAGDLYIDDIRLNRP